mgnify:CR=1 FL=1
MTLEDLIRSTTQSQRSRIVRFSVSKGLPRSGNESDIIKGCNVLKETCGIATMQYAHVAEIDAFVNFSNGPHFHYSAGTRVADDLLSGKPICPASYK